MKSQTATEYLVILAVVIILSIITVTTLSSVSLFSQKDKANDAFLKNQEIGIMDYSTSIGQTKLELRNNKNEFVRINTLIIDNKECTASELNTIFRSGETRYITCGNIKGQTAGDLFEWKTNITYEVLKTSAEFTIADLSLEGIVANSINRGLF